MNAGIDALRRDTTHLSPGELERLRAALTEERDTHHRQLAELRAAADAARSDSSTERELAERAAALGAEALAEVEAALARIDAGVYGLCERCGGPIATPRLEAIPQARHCVGCPASAPGLFG